MADDPLAQLRARFRQRCAEDAASLRAHLAGQMDVELEQRVHRLAGSAGTFGYGDISQAAAAIDACLAEHRQPRPEALADLVNRLEKLTSA